MAQSTFFLDGLAADGVEIDYRLAAVVGVAVDLVTSGRRFLEHLDVLVTHFGNLLLHGRFAEPFVFRLICAGGAGESSGPREADAQKGKCDIFTQHVLFPLDCGGALVVERHPLDAPSLSIAADKSLTMGASGRRCNAERRAGGAGGEAWLAPTGLQRA